MTIYDSIKLITILLLKSLIPRGFRTIIHHIREVDYDVRWAPPRAASIINSLFWLPCKILVQNPPLAYLDTCVKQLAFWIAALQARVFGDQNIQFLGIDTTHSLKLQQEVRTIALQTRQCT